MLCKGLMLSGTWRMGAVGQEVHFAPFDWRLSIDYGHIAPLTLICLDHE